MPFRRLDPVARSLRTRVVLWLAAVALPIAVASVLATEIVEDRLNQRVEADLANSARLEAARIDDSIVNYLEDAKALAMGEHVKDFTADVVAVRAGELPEGTVIGAVEGFAEVDAFGAAPLLELSNSVLSKAQTTGSVFVDLAIIAPDGIVLGATEGFSSTISQADLEGALASKSPHCGEAFRAGSADDRIPIATPILVDDEPVGILLVEAELGPIVDLAVAHEGIGETSEAHLAQPTVSGDAEFITQLRFDREAAFTTVIPATTGAPIVQALASPEVQVLRSPDYRSIDSILAIQTIEHAGWGLVVKIDASEATAPVAEIQRIIYIALAAGVAAVVIGWLIFVTPLARRLLRTARAAQSVGAGNLDMRIDDARSDEIGVVATSIDQLAADLQADKARRAEAEAELRFRATHDALTGLMNRQSASEVLGTMFGEGAKYPQSSVLFLDLDGFKQVNDTFGHDVGDRLLAEVARMLSDVSPTDAKVARWGGDEFLIQLPGADEPRAQLVAERIRTRMFTALLVEGDEHFVTASIGHATGGSDVSVDVALREADLAMFAEKSALQRRSTDQVQPIHRIVASALADNRVSVAYQPIVEVLTGTDYIMIGVEALARLRDEHGMMMMPGDFVPPISGSDLGAMLDRTVTATALAELGRWRAEGLVDDGFFVAVNVSEASSADPTYPTFIQRQLELHGLPGSAVLVEISEGIPEIDHGAMQRLRNTGVGLALDDFGLGSSNMDRASDYEADVAKIDRRWMGDPDGELDSDELRVLESMTTLCTSLGLTVIAEGVESAAQLAAAQHLGINMLQGFLFGRGCTALEFRERLLDGVSEPTDSVPISAVP